MDNKEIVEYTNMVKTLSIKSMEEGIDYYSNMLKVAEFRLKTLKNALFLRKVENKAKRKSLKDKNGII